MQVVRSQAKGLTTEYDRLLSQYGQVERKLQQADPLYGGGGAFKHD